MTLFIPCWTRHTRLAAAPGALSNSTRRLPCSRRPGNGARAGVPVPPGTARFMRRTRRRQRWRQQSISTRRMRRPWPLVSGRGRCRAVEIVRYREAYGPSLRLMNSPKWGHWSIHAR